jgi:nucleoid DNA-binding protein
MLSRAASGLPRSDAERVVTALVQRVVENLRDGNPVDLESLIEAERARYGGRPEKNAEKSEKPAVVGKKS